MTPDDFAAILAARTPGSFPAHQYADAVDEAWVERNTEYLLGGLMGRDARAIVAAVNLAPLLLDLWRAAALVPIEHGGEPETWIEAFNALDAALAALEAAT